MSRGSTDWHAEATAVLLSAAKGDFSARMTRSGARDDEDAIAFLINAAVDELSNLFEESARQKRELEHANRELREAQASLVQSARMASLGQMAGAVAHEINNPLMAVAAGAEFLAEDLDELDPEVVIGHPKLAVWPEHLGRLRAASERCRVVVRGLLDFARDRETAPREVDLARAARTSITLVSAQIQRSATKLRVDMPQPLWIMGEHTQLGQMVLNLVINASQATGAGGQVSVRGWVEDGRVLLSVRDDGCGIPAENLERICEPFFTTREVGAGAGLGLSVVHGIVEQHGGGIEIDSVVGRGTTVVLSFPEVGPVPGPSVPACTTPECDSLP